MKRARGGPDASTDALLREADEALGAYDIERASRALEAARAHAPRDLGVLAAWVAHLTDRLADDARALDAASGFAPAAMDEETRARLAAAASRLGRVDDARRWIAEVPVARATDAHAAWLDALTAIGRIDEGAEVARALRTQVARSPAALAALTRFDAESEALRRRARAQEGTRVAQREADALDAARGLIEEGRWAGALAALMAAGEPETHALRAAWRALVADCVARREREALAATDARVAAVEAQLAAGVDATSLRAFAALDAQERARVRSGLAPDALDALLRDGRTRVAEAVDATLALREAAGASDAAAAALLRRHAAALRRVPAGRAALDAAESAVRAERAALQSDRDDGRIRTEALRAEVDALAARGDELAAWWRAREAPELGETAAALRARVEAAAQTFREEEADGPEEEFLGELLRGDALIARPTATEVRALSMDAGVLTARAFDLRTHRVTARVTARAGVAFEARAARWDRRWHALASPDALVSVDARDGALRARWRIGATGLLGAAARPCADPDFVWVIGRDASGEEVARVLDLARGDDVRGFAIAGAVDLAGGEDVVTHERATRQLQLRDAHGVVVATCPFDRSGELLSAVRTAAPRGAVVLFRERHAQSAEDRRRSRPPRFSFALLRIQAGSRAVAVTPLRDALRDETGVVAADLARGLAWVRLAPDDLPGELLTVRLDDLSVRARRGVSAGVALRPLGDAEGARLEFLCARSFSWTDNLWADPPGATEVPLARFQPSVSRILPCAPGPTEDAWRAHAPTLMEISRGEAGALDEALARHRRSPAALLGLVRALVACGLTDAAAEALRRARALHPGHGPLRLQAADQAWAIGRADLVREALEGAELLGVGAEFAHAKHLLGLARLAEGDEVGADAAWREGADAPIARPECALGASRTALAARAGALVDSSCVTAVALSGGSSAALRASRDPGLCALHASAALAEGASGRADAAERLRIAAALQEALRRAPALRWRPDISVSKVMTRCLA